MSIVRFNRLYNEFKDQVSDPVIEELFKDYFYLAERLKCLWGANRKFNPDEATADVKERLEVLAAKVRDIGFRSVSGYAFLTRILDTTCACLGDLGRG